MVARTEMEEFQSEGMNKRLINFNSLEKCKIAAGFVSCINHSVKTSY